MLVNLSKKIIIQLLLLLPHFIDQSIVSGSVITLHKHRGDKVLSDINKKTTTTESPIKDENNTDNSTVTIVHITETGLALSHKKLLKYLYPLATNLEEIQSENENTWHFVPYKTAKYFIGDVCEVEEEGENIPGSLFTDEQLKHGAILLYFFGSIYLFTLLTVVCNDYFLPTVEVICDRLSISKDVAAATFMATATTTPEFFTNTISTFITQSDLGLGTIIGSLAFNTLGVAALAGLAAPRPVHIDWWPLSRDCILYSINLSVLIFFAWDGLIYWYEGLVFVVLYFLYFIILFNNQRIMRFAKKYIEDRWKLCRINSYNIDQCDEVVTVNSTKNKDPTIRSLDSPIFIIPDDNAVVIKSSDNDDVKNRDFKKCASYESTTDSVYYGIDLKTKERKSLWQRPCDKSKLQTFWYFYTWPIKFMLTISIPSPKTYPKLFPITFFMCIIWIGANSYLVVWMIVRIGLTFNIPDSVMGLTFLAAGGCLPEAISAFLMARQGEGGMGVSNSLGANSLSIIFSLGLPWFIRTLTNGAQLDESFVNIQSYGIEFVILSLIGTVAALFLVIAMGKFRLKKLVGCVLLLFYAVFITLAILVEIDVFFPSGNGCGN